MFLFTSCDITYTSYTVAYKAGKIIKNMNPHLDSNKPNNRPHFFNTLDPFAKPKIWS